MWPGCGLVTVRGHMCWYADALWSHQRWHLEHLLRGSAGDRRRDVEMLWWLSLSVVLLHPSPFTFPICTWLFQMPFCKAQHFSTHFPQTFRFGRCCVCKLRNHPNQCPPGLILLLGVLFYTVGAFGEIFSHNPWLNLTLTVLITRY